METKTFFAVTGGSSKQFAECAPGPFYSVSISSRRYLTLFLPGLKYKCRESGIYPVQVTGFYLAIFCNLNVNHA